MRELSENEIETVSGGYDIPTAAMLTVGLMALAPASVAVITAGTVALTFYATAFSYRRR